MANIPASLGEVSASWLQSALTDAGHPVPEIVEISFEPMPGVVGALGEIGIFTIAYADETDMATRLVGKCPLDDDTARMYNQVMAHYSRETGFYADMAGRIDMMTLPECFVNVADHTGDSNLLIIEFVGDATDGDILAGTDTETMLALTEDLARMHGKFWLDDSLTEFPWLLDWTAPSFDFGIPITQDGWAKFNAVEPDFFDKDLAAACESRWVNDTNRCMEAMAQRAWTFTHGDYELDNMLFREGQSPVILDWQTVMRAFPGLDLGWFLACSHTPETLAEEQAILDRYRTVLAASGGPSWGDSELKEDMAWGMAYHCVGQTVTNTLGYEGRAKLRFRHMLEGCHAASLRWGLTEVLAGF